MGFIFHPDSKCMESAMIDLNNSTEYTGPSPENLTYQLSNCSACTRVRPPTELPPYLQVTATAVCAVILTLGTAGNVLVSAVVWRTKELRNSTNLFLINLSFADLLVLLVCVPPTLVELQVPEVWLLGEGMCKAVPYIELLAAHGSILTILAISFERYYAICEPLKAGYTCTQIRALAIICGVWLVAALATGPVLLIVHYEMAETMLDDDILVPVCLHVVDRWWQRLYYLALLALFFVVPFVVLTAVYCRIGRHLMLGRRRLAPCSEEAHMRARRQVVLMLIAVVVSFFVCLLPFRILSIWILLATPSEVESLGMERYYNLLYFCRLLLYMNSALNPILYNAISSNFRNSVLRLLRCSKSSNRVLTRQITKGTTTSSTATSGGSVKKEALLGGSLHKHITVAKVWNPGGATKPQHV